MLAVPIRFSAVRTAATALTALFLFAPHAEASPLAVSLVSLSAIKPQLELQRPDLIPQTADLSRQMKRRLLRAQRVAHAKRSRIARAHRIRQARAELARFERMGPLHCLQTAVYFEARDESVRGQRAVAAVILARTKVPGRPKTVCGVVFEGSWRKTGCQFSFACDGRVDIPRWKERWERAKASAAYVWNNRKRAPKFARGATFYHASYVKPRWAKQMVRVAKIGLHIFYRPRRGRLG